MLYLIGLGIHDEKDISLKGIEAAKNCEHVFMELYTCPLKINVEFLEKLIMKKIEVLERGDVEEKNVVLQSAKICDTALLAGGDALFATTHITLALDAKKKGIPVEIIHASSIFTAIAETGLQLYKFGPAVSIPKPQANYSPESFYDSILENRERGLHTLILLDIGMTAGEGIKILLEAEIKKKKKLFLESTEIIAVAHLGAGSRIMCGRMSELQKTDLGELPHSLILPGKLHFMEEEFIGTFRGK